MIFSGTLVWITACDIRRRRIPNECCLVIAGLAVLDGISSYDRLLGAVLISVPMLILSAMTGGSFGGGDIKLMAAGGLFLGWKRILYAAVIAILLAGVYCMVGLISGKITKKSRIALGPFLCMGMIMVLI